MKNLNEILSSVSNDDLASAGSAFQTVLERRQQFLSQGSVALKQAVVEQPVETVDTNYELPECIKNLSLDEIFEKGKLSDEELEKLKKSHANDNFDDFPTDPTEIAKLLISVEASIKTELLVLKATPLDVRSVRTAPCQPGFMRFVPRGTA